MKTEAAEFKKVIEEAKAREAKIEPVKLAALKWHLLLEKDLDTYLQKIIPNPLYIKIDDMQFRRKGEWALALSAGNDKDLVWAVFWAFNQLRNKIAHEADPKATEEKMAYLRKVYIAALEPAQRADAEKKKDPEIVEEACWLVMGFFGQLGMQAGR